MKMHGTVKTCPKCGGESISYEYDSGVLMEVIGVLGKEQATYGEEHIKATCDRCGYVEKEKPLDGNQDEH